MIVDMSCRKFLFLPYSTNPIIFLGFPLMNKSLMNNFTFCSNLLSLIFILTQILNILEPKTFFTGHFPVKKCIHPVLKKVKNDIAEHTEKCNKLLPK